MSQANKFSHVDYTVVQQVSEILERKLPSILEPHGLSFELGNNIEFMPEEGWLNFNGLRLAVSLDGKRPLSAREQALQYELNQRKGGSFELDPQKPGATIDGQECVLVGFFKPRAATYPFVIRMLDSEKEYVIDTHTANRIFGSHPHLAHIGGADA